MKTSEILKKEIERLQKINETLEKRFDTTQGTPTAENEMINKNTLTMCEIVRVSGIISSNLEK